MRKTNSRNGHRLHLVPLVLGAYGAFLGYGLVLAGIENLSGAVGPIRLLLGLAMIGFGLFGIWDGIRDVIRPQVKPKPSPPAQYVLTDGSGSRTSNVTAELIREEIGKLGEGERDSFHLQLLTPLEIPDWGNLKQVTCTAQTSLTLLAFLQTADGGWRLRTCVMPLEVAADWFRQLLEGASGFPGLDGWESLEEIPGETQETGKPEGQEYRARVLCSQTGTYTVWHQLLVVFGESWHDEHKFFSVRDVELVIEGIHEGKYQKAVLEWGTQAVDLFPGVENDLVVIWCTNNAWKGDTRFLTKTGTVTQVKFWMAGYLDCGFFEQQSGWTDITDQIEKARRKGETKYGKVF